MRCYVLAFCPLSYIHGNQDQFKVGIVICTSFTALILRKPPKPICLEILIVHQNTKSDFDIELLNLITITSPSKPLTVQLTVLAVHTEFEQSKQICLNSRPIEGS